MPYVYLGYKPYSIQLKTIDFLLRNKRAYIFSELGSGKTASVLWACDQLMEIGKIKKVLIISPVSIMYSVWTEELKNILPNRSYSVVHGNREQRITALSKKVGYYITNSDAPRTYLEELIKLKPDIIVIDELEVYKNSQSKRSKKVHKLCNIAKAVWGMTGIPMGNSPLEAFGIAKTINPSNLPTPYVTKWKSMTMIQINLFIWVPNRNCEKTVYKVLQPAIRFKLEDCADIPDIIYETMDFEMSSEQKKLYKEIFQHQIAEYKDGLIIASTAAVKFTKLLQIAAGVVLDVLGNPLTIPNSQKLEAVNNIRKQTKKLIIFIQFVAVAKLLSSKIEKSLLIYGDVPVKKRAQIIKEFEYNDDYDTLIIHPRVGAHGLNLQFASTIIFWTPILGNSYYRQCIGRIRRSGQKNKQVIINFSSSDVERKMFKTLETKEISSQLLLNMYTN